MDNIQKMVLSDIQSPCFPLAIMVVSIGAKLATERRGVIMSSTPDNQPQVKYVGVRLPVRLDWQFCVTIYLYLLTSIGKHKQRRKHDYTTK